MLLWDPIPFSKSGGLPPHKTGAGTKSPYAGSLGLELDVSAARKTTVGRYGSMVGRMAAMASLRIARIISTATPERSQCVNSATIRDGGI